MSEWIKRSEQEPAEGELVEFYFPPTLSGQRHGVVCVGCWGEWENFSHWRYHTPPTRTVTIEISEDDARFWAAPPPSEGDTPRNRLAAATKRALERKR